MKSAVKSIGLLLILMLSASLLALQPAPVKAASSRTIAVSAGGSIQAAIDRADAGDTVLVKSGTYDLSKGGQSQVIEGRLCVYTSLRIDKPISLIGENRSDTIISLIEYWSPGTVNRGIIVEAADVLISNLTIISNITAFNLIGNNVTLTNNSFNCTDSGVAVTVNGNAVISSNVMENGIYGIKVRKGNVTIFNNTIRGFQTGITLEETSGATRIFSNQLINNSIGVAFSKAPSLFHNNNLVNCSKYSVTLGSLGIYGCPGTSENVDATNNYWGTTNQTDIANSIYDNKNDSSLGNVTYAPFLIPSSDSTSPQNSITPQPTQPNPDFIIILILISCFLIAVLVLLFLRDRLKMTRC